MSQQGADLIGRTLGRTYQVERLLGGGGMGAVWAARHVRTGGLFAVKILHSETAADSDIYKRFQDEARTVSALRHPHIVQVTDFDQDDDGTPFIVMELLEGEDLYQRLCRVGKLPMEQVLDIGRQVGSALHAAHEKGIIHRDIKPQNIFLVRHEVADMVTEVAKVVDFGISKIRRTGQQMTRDMTILGTPQFMSPEAALGQNSQLDGRADQWSLAVIMYLSITGRLPFDGDNLVGVLYMVVHEQPVQLKLLAPDIPEPMLVAIERAMSKKKEDRYPRMVDFVRALTGLGVTNAASVRFSSLQMPSAQQGDINATQQLMPPGHAVPAGADARTAAPHLMGNLPHAPSPVAAAAPWNPGAAPPRSPTPPQQQTTQPTHVNNSDAVTKAPHLAAGGELPPTRPALALPGKEISPLTVPLGQPPELVATPTSPTSFSPLGTGPVPAARPATRPTGPSGNTPTNIALTDLELQALMSGSETTPDPQPPVEDLQGVPTRVVLPGSEDRTIARYQVPQNATVPLGLLPRPYGVDSQYDAANPNTLSHATGQEVSLKPRLLPAFPKIKLPPLPPWPVVRKAVFELIGVVPRSSVRLAVTGCVLTLLLALVVILLASGGSDPPATEDKSGVTSTTADGTSRDAALAGLLVDGGSGPSAAIGKEPKLPDPHGAGENVAKPTPGKPVKPIAIRKGGKNGVDVRKH